MALIGTPTDPVRSAVMVNNRSTDPGLLIARYVSGLRADGNVAAPPAASQANVELTGVRLGFLNGNRLTRGTRGIVIRDASGYTTASLRLRGNATSASSYEGILVAAAAPDTMVDSNSTRTAERGIVVGAAGRGVTISDNTSLDNRAVDCVDGTGSTRTSLRNTWTGNTGRTATPKGICTPTGT